MKAPTLTAVYWLTKQHSHPTLLLGHDASLPSPSPGSLSDNVIRSINVDR